MMKTKIRTLTVICLLPLSTPIYADGLSLPDITTLEAMARERGELKDGPQSDGIIYNEHDFDPPPKGKIQKAELKWLKKLADEITLNLTAAPNNTGGKQSLWYPGMLVLRNGLVHAVQTEKEQDLLNLTGHLISFAERDQGMSASFGPELQEVEWRMLSLGTSIIRALAYHIQNGSGEVEAGLLRQAVRLFGNGRLVDESAWDVDDLMPVDSAGMFILNPDLAIEEVKKRSPERVRYFLTNVSEPSEFFARYAATGDGLAKLKTKYAAGKSTIDARFRTLAAWAATLPK